jgi:hypothetical protein
MPLHTCYVPTFTKTTYTESQSNRTQITGNNGTGRNSLPESAEKSSRAFHRRRDRSGESRGGRMWRTRANRELYDHVRHERLLQNAGRPKIWVVLSRIPRELQPTKRTPKEFAHLFAFSRRSCLLPFSEATSERGHKSLITTVCIFTDNDWGFSTAIFTGYGTGPRNCATTAPNTADTEAKAPPGAGPSVGACETQSDSRRRQKSPISRFLNGSVSRIKICLVTARCLIPLNRCRVKTHSRNTRCGKQWCTSRGKNFIELIVISIYRTCVCILCTIPRSVR